MAAAKTRPTDVPVADHLATIADDAQRADAIELDARMSRVVGAPGVMWGEAIVGYGSRPITYADGRVEDWMLVGFAARAGKLAIYGLGSVPGGDEVRTRLGKHSGGKSCLYVKRLADIDLDVLDELVALARDSA